MAKFSVACPQCHAALCSSRPFPPGKQVRCPQCGAQFVASEQPSSQPAFANRKKQVIAACAAGLLLVAAAAGGTMVIMRQKPAEPVANEEKRDARADEDRKELERKVKQLEDENRAIKADGDKKKKQEDFARLMQKGKEAFDKKNYKDAVEAYSEAHQLCPDGPEGTEALTGLVSARTLGGLASKEDDDRRIQQAEYQARMAEGRKARDDKNYTAAVLAFEAALAAHPGDGEAAKARDEIKALMASDAMANKTLEDFQKRMVRAQIAMAAQDYKEAAAEYALAAALIPTNADARKGILAAQARIDALKNAANNEAEAQKLVAKGREDLRCQRYTDAIANFQTALGLNPNDPAAKLALDDAVKARDKARIEYTKYMNQAATARQLNDYASALLAYQAALQVIPNDADATAGVREVNIALATVQVALANLPGLIIQGQQALDAKRYDLALTFFNQALQIAPTDLTALAGQREATLSLGRKVEKAVDFDQLLAQGATALQQLKYGDAIRLFTDAQRLKPESERAKDGLRKARYGKDMADGMQALNVRKYTDAVAFFEGALREMPGDNQATLKLSLARQLAAGKK